MIRKPANASQITEEYTDALVAAFREHGSLRAAARAMGVDRNAIRRAIKRAADAEEAAERPHPVEDLPPADIPIEDLIEMQARRFEHRLHHATAKRWRKFNVPADGPYALMFVGDPHVDDNGSNLILLREHAQICRDNAHVYAINIGDSTNNCTGRLARLWAEQDTSASTARRMAEWLLNRSGFRWWLWLHGNHDLWDGPVGAAWFEAVKPHFVAMEDWQAKVTLRSPNGHELRLWVAHNFKGSSIWNNMHGLERAAQMQDWAHLYVSGHHHDVGLRQGENPHRNFVYWLARCRGYKFIDHYAELHGFGAYQHGASVLAVIDPGASKPNAIQCFMDPQEGVEFLAWKRRSFD